ncbi:MAG: exo-alpha-sialidase, partial [Candidatus Saccharimonas sp.]|nr:exo-alpha-sialidase [Planctomycetaceae bacterium]
MTRGLIGLVCTLLATTGLPTTHAAEPVEYTVKLDTVMSGFDGKTCWVAPRAGVVHGPQPSIIFTMQKLLLTGSDIFFAVNEVRSDDLGQTWLPPLEHPQTLGRRQEPNGIEIVAGDMVPKWHAKTGRLLSTGPTVRYKRNAAGAEVKISQNEASSRTAYSVYDPQQRTWTAWDTIVMPEAPKFFYATVGASQ